MKVSIITVCFNSKKTIIATLNSVLTQSYKNIEHIIIDGKSSDGTGKILKDYPFKRKIIISEKDNGLYDAINKGIKIASGDIIGVLHSDDIYNSNLTIEHIVNLIKKNKNINIFCSDIVFFRGNNFSKISRYYSAYDFKKNNFKYGLMPPHPGVFIRSSALKDNIKYNINYKIASDFDFLCKLILKEKIRYKILNILSVRMRAGGISGKNLKSYLISTKEIFNSLKSNKIRTNIFYVLSRIPSKLMQYVKFNTYDLNRNFKFKIHKFYWKFFNLNFKILRSINNLNFNKNFVLSGMNLAFLGYLSKGDIKNYRTLINWPDGVFSKLYGNKILKIPGRDLLTKIKLPDNIKKIIVCGNLTSNGRKYLEKKFKLPIINIKLPYGSINKILNKFNLKTNKNELVFITLPTPKQEVIAERISKLNNNYRVICIGASIGIACGDEKRVPNFIKNFEFLWRLRYETFRRTKRLLETFIYYFSGIFISRKIRNLEIEVV
jgi:glycosyltransferase involved in cell wall biosynthesis